MNHSAVHSCDSPRRCAVRVWVVLTILALTSVLPPTLAARSGDSFDLSQAVVVVSPQVSAREEKAVELLVEEVAKRTLIRLPVRRGWPSERLPVIAVGRDAHLGSFAGPHAGAIAREPRPAGAEGFRIRTAEPPDGAAFVVITGVDERGVLFGVGRLLRELSLSRGRVVCPRGFEITTAPETPLRGHQLGFRPKTNSYDGWSLEIWDQYIRDLIVFGTNAVELIPPRSDDAAGSPHFPLPQIDTMVGVSRMLDAYDLDVWVWYPALDLDYSDPATVEFALKEWGEVFKVLPRLDAVFVPGGDPGHTEPRYMMGLLEKVAVVLKRYHPSAEMWMSPQGFKGEWMQDFLEILRRQRPKWLSGIVHGPQVRVGLAELRRLVPEEYPIRRYPDITHCLDAQFPVPDWDFAFARTQAREVINPRPRAQANICRKLREPTIGFITYSEGCNDDVNKFVWSGIGWDPETPLIEILRQYSRYFIGERYEDEFAHLLLDLERNWEGSLIANDRVDTTLRKLQALESVASPQDLLNWRLQQVRYRAYYDAYVRQRLIYETELENRAMDVLRRAPELGSELAMARAREILSRAVLQPVAVDYRARVFEMAEALYQSIRMQLSVERYQAIAIRRGANLDEVDKALNNRPWLEAQFKEIAAMEGEKDRLAHLDAIVNWTNPGLGGFYDDLGNLTQQPHLVRGVGSVNDPDFSASSLVGFESDHYEPWRTSWLRHAYILFDVPLELHYENLDPTAAYRLRINYGGDNPNSQVQCWADDHVVHELRHKAPTGEILEFDVAPELTRDGTLRLTWRQAPGAGGSGRGCHVAEVWLVKKRTAKP